MKKLILLPLFAMFCLGAKAQDSTFLHQGFDECDSIVDLAGTENHFPPGWSAYSVSGAQDWRCETAYGVGNGPCIHINGYQAGASNEDENWLISPPLNLSGYTDTCTLSFAATYYYGGDSLHVMVSTNYNSGVAAAGFNNPDSTAYTWVELPHNGVMLYDTFYNETGVFDYFTCNLTPYITSGTIHVAFKYTSTITDASVWDLDDIETLGAMTTGITNVTKQTLPVSVLGISTSSDVNVSFDVAQGQYELAIYDLPGRKVYSQNILAQGGKQTLSITDANLANGMYVLKVGDQKMYGVTKFTVQ